MIGIDDILITQKGDFITGLSFEKNTHKVLSPLLREAYRQVESYLKGDLRVFDLPLYLEGTDFQRGVWGEMQKIPYGTTVTYKDLGVSLNTKGFRAIGSACGKNPIPIIIPCHRVVAVSGIGGFSCGIDIKKQLMDIEKICY